METRTLRLGPDIPRWKMFSGKKYWFDKAETTKEEAKRTAAINRKIGYLVRTQKHSKPFRMEYDKNIYRYTIWLYKPEV